MADLLNHTVTSEADVVVVGGGPAGIGAVSALMHRDVVLLEAEDRLGGRMRSLARGEVWLNLGAHVLPAGGAIGRLLEGADLQLVPVPGTRSALWFGGRLHDRTRVEAYPLVLPLSWRERLALARIGLRLRLGVEGWRRAARPRRGEDESQAAVRLRRYRSRRTFGEMLGELEPRVAALFETATRRSAGEADRISEGGALALFGALWASRDRAGASNVVGGSGRLGEAWMQRLGDRARTGARVTAVVERPDHVEVAYVDRSGHEHRLRARHAVVAVPAPQAASVVVGLPDAVRAELNSVAYGSFVCLSVLTRPLAVTPCDDIYAVAAPDMPFDMLFHHSNPVVSGRRGPDLSRSLMCYAGGDKATALLQLDDDEVCRRLLGALHEVLPELRDVVVETVVTRWREGNCYPTPGGSVASVEAWNRRPDARVVLAGDYFAPLGGTVEAAARSGLASAGMLPSRERTSPMTEIKDVPA